MTENFTWHDQLYAASVHFLSIPPHHAHQVHHARILALNHVHASKLKVQLTASVVACISFTNSDTSVWRTTTLWFGYVWM